MNKFMKTATKLLLSAILLLTLTATPVVAASGQINQHPEALIASMAQQGNFNGMTIQIGDYEVSFGEEKSVATGLTRSAGTLTGSTSVSRPVIGGNMSVTATSSTDVRVHMIAVRAGVNSGGTQVTWSAWTRLNDTTFASASITGVGRTGVGHGNHEARLTSNAPLTTLTTDNRSFQP